LELTLDSDNSREHNAGEKRKRCSETGGNKRAAVDAEGTADTKRLSVGNCGAKLNNNKKRSQEVVSAWLPKRRKETRGVEKKKDDGPLTDLEPKKVVSETGKAGVQASTVTSKAVKADDAKVPFHLWNDRVFARPSLKRLESLAKEKKEKALNKLRAGFHVIWKRKVERDFVEWFHSTEHRYDNREDIWRAGLQSCVYARRSDWWEWTGGVKDFLLEMAKTILGGG
jgi:hypothetical protein